MMEARGQGGQAHRSLLVAPTSCAPKPAGGGLRKESASFHLKIVNCRTSSKNQMRVEAKGPLGTRLPPICFIDRTLKE